MDNLEMLQDEWCCGATVFICHSVSFRQLSADVCGDANKISFYHKVDLTGAAITPPSPPFNLIDM